MYTVDMQQKDMSRFLSKIEFTDNCWLWQGSISRTKYGVFSLNNKMLYAHRLSYELWVGPLCEGQVIDHLCEVRNCICPEHLEQVSHKENVYRATGASEEECPNGHPRSKFERRTSTKNQLYCTACLRIKGRGIGRTK